MSTTGNLIQIAPGHFPEAQQRALNDAIRQINELYPTLLNDKTVATVVPTATLGNVITALNQVIAALRSFGLKGT